MRSIVDAFAVNSTAKTFTEVCLSFVKRYVLVKAFVFYQQQSRRTIMNPAGNVSVVQVPKSSHQGA